MEKRIKLIVIGILVIVAVVTGVKTWGIVRDEVIPDLKGESAGTETWDEHSDSWSFEVEDDFDLEIELTDVDVVFKTHEAATVLASFEGERKAVRRSSRVELTGSESGGRVRLYEDRSKSDNPLGLNNSTGKAGGGEYRGVMTVTLPRDMLRTLNVRLFSGDISIRDCKAARMSLESTGGDLTAADLVVAESLKLSTFSGDVELTAFEADDCALGNSTGATRVKNGVAGSLYVEQYSGKLSLEDVTAEGRAIISSSDGDLTLARLTADSFSAEASAGKMDFTGLEITGTAEIRMAEGTVTLTDLTAQRIETVTVAGDVTGTGMMVREVSGRSESGLLDLSIPLHCHVRVVSGSGDVRLALEQGMGFRLTVSTQSGEQDIGFKIGKYYTGSAGDSSYEAQVGKGERKVNIETESGSISIQPLAVE